MDKYTFEKCRICGEYRALKDGVCGECNKEIELPECFKEIFGDFNGK